MAWAGSLMGDFHKGSDFGSLPDELVRHLRLHRHIDRFTSRSEDFQRSRRRLDPRFRYARGVLVDVFYDHFLACHWSDFHPLALPRFSQQVYRGLQDCYNLLSPGLQQQLPRMIEFDWLTSYQNPEVVRRVLMRLEERLAHKFPLEQGYVELQRFKPELEEDFKCFMGRQTLSCDTGCQSTEMSGFRPQLKRSFFVIPDRWSFF